MMSVLLIDHSFGILKEQVFSCTTLCFHFERRFLCKNLLLIFGGVQCSWDDRILNRNGHSYPC